MQTGVKYLFAALLLLVAVVNSKEVYLFDVELPEPLKGDVIHIPGVNWELGSQAWIFLVPVEEGDAVYALTGNTTRVRVYDARRVVVAIPAVEPPKRKASAWLETPVGRYPVEIKKPERGIAETIASSLEEVVEVLKQNGFSAKYVGKARLVIETQERQPEGIASTSGEVIQMQTSYPATGTTYTVYGGVYFRQVRIDKAGSYVVPPIAQGGLILCSNVPNAAFIGYDAVEMYIGAFVKGSYSNVRLRIEVETYRLSSAGINVYCERTGVLRFNLVNKTRYYVQYVNASASAAMPMAVVVRVIAEPTSSTYTLNVAVSVNASVAYRRTYTYGFEMSQFMSYTTGEAASINQYVSRIVLGPYFIPDGIAYGQHKAYVSITTRPVSGACPPLAVDMNVNAMWAAYRQIYPYSSTSTSCLYFVDLSAPVDAWTTSWTKSFSGGFYYVLRIRYTTTTELPYVYSIAVMPHEALRGWRWAEVWRSSYNGRIDSIWEYPHSTAQIQILYTRYPPQEGTIGPLVIVHGLFTFNVHATTSSDAFFTMSVAGRQSTSLSSTPMKRFEVVLKFSRVVAPQGRTLFLDTHYVQPAGSLEAIQEPWWLFWARLAKTAVDFAVALLDIGRVASLLYTAISFAADRALDTAVTTASLTRIDNYTIKITWQRGWGDNAPNDKVHLRVRIPQSVYYSEATTRVVVDQLCLEYVCYSPGLEWYIRPTSGLLYPSIGHPRVKVWMFSGLTDARSGWFEE
ncbi:hypothetical protein Pogu_2247 [Pyrobaculum oguniense TE7]|uniref:Uncharacterized protein n=1 Tax=Pyrobaculum oguniense (strain DSM 13380 / JCM 10595 / TE7) TaxID=698757 RepID=H6QD06_PYROT|nr:hypothetical protein Pogu_2247 [Pyrobaculum oguniense TE7]